MEQAAKIKSPDTFFTSLNELLIWLNTTINQSVATEPNRQSEQLGLITKVLQALFQQSVWQDQNQLVLIIEGLLMIAEHSLKRRYDKEGLEAQIEFLNQKLLPQLPALLALNDSTLLEQFKAQIKLLLSDYIREARKADWQKFNTVELAALPFEHTLLCVENYLSSLNSLQTSAESRLSHLEAEFLYQTAWPYVKNQVAQAGQHSTQIKALSQLGVLLQQTGQYEEAIQLYTTSLPHIIGLDPQWPQVMQALVNSLNQAVANELCLPDWHRYRSVLTQHRSVLQTQLTMRTGKALESFNQKFKAFTLELWQDSQALLGPAPVKFCILALGSMSQNMLSAYSDVEYAIVTETVEAADWETHGRRVESTAHYLKSLCELFEFKVVTLGESLEGHRGYQLDINSQPRTEPSLRGTVKQLVARCMATEINAHDGLVYSLLHAEPLYGDIALAKAFQQTLAEAIAKASTKLDAPFIPGSPAERIPWHQYWALAQFERNLAEYHKYLVAKLAEPDLKKPYIKLLRFMVLDLALYLNLPAQNTREACKQLKSLGLDAVWLNEVQSELHYLLQERSKVHLARQQEDDAPLPEHTERLVLIEVQLLKPFFATVRLIKLYGYEEWQRVFKAIHLSRTWHAQGLPWLNEAVFYKVLAAQLELLTPNPMAGSLAFPPLWQAYSQLDAKLATQSDLLPVNLLNKDKTKPVSQDLYFIGLLNLLSALQTSLEQFNALNTDPTKNAKVLKSTFYATFAYLALSLKLENDLTAHQPEDLLAQASNTLGWGQALITQLLQAVLTFLNPQPVAAKDEGLTADTYIGLSLIYEGLLLPLYHWLEAQLANHSAFSLVNALPMLLGSYLATRHESWLQQWTQHPSHKLSMAQLLAHPLLRVLADTPSADGWSPTYAHEMSEWLEQVQALASTEQSSCSLEGLLDGQCHYLPVELVKVLFNAQGEFIGNVHDSAQSKISKITFRAPGTAQGTTYYFKVKSGNEAGLMGREYAVITLHQLLGGPSHLALGWPLKLTYSHHKKTKVYFCWVSKAIPGMALTDVMRDQELATCLNHIQMNSYSHLFITHYLTCPEDAQPDNLTVEQNQAGHVILRGMDTGQSFVNVQHVNQVNQQVLMVKTMVYLLESAMRQVLDAQVLARIMLLDPKQIVTNWWHKLDQLMTLFNPLYEDYVIRHKIKPSDQNKYRLLDFSIEMQLCVWERFKRLSDWLYRYPTYSKSGLVLLKALDPIMGKQYEVLLGKVKTPEDFYAIDPKAYAKNLATGKMVSSTTYRQIQQQTLTPESLQRSLNLGEAYFAGIDFRKIKDEQEQRFVLKLLQAAINNKQRFTYLNLSGCTVIDETTLFALLEKLTELKELHLEDCPQFNLNTLFSLFSLKCNEQTGFFQPTYDVLCPQLEKLTITLDGQVRHIDVGLSEASRKQLLAFTTQWQKFLQMMLDKLLFKLNDWNGQAAIAVRWQHIKKYITNEDSYYLSDDSMDEVKQENWDVQGEAADTLGELADRLSIKQVDNVITKLLERLDKFNKEDEDVYNWNVPNSIYSSLNQLTAKLSAKQANNLSQKLLAKIESKSKYAWTVALKCLEKLEPKLLDTQTHIVISKLLFQLDDKDAKLQVAIIFSLGELVAKLSAEQITHIINKLLTKLSDQRKKIQIAAITTLSHLASMLSPEQVSTVKLKLFTNLIHLIAKLNDINVKAQTMLLQTLIDIIIRLTSEQVDEVKDKLITQLNNQNNQAVRAEILTCLIKITLKLCTEQIKTMTTTTLLNSDLIREYIYQALAKPLLELTHTIPTAMIDEAVMTLSPKYMHWDRDVNKAISMCLIQLADRFSEAQWLKAIDNLVAQLIFNDYSFEKSLVAMECLQQLLAKLPDNMLDQITIRLCTILETRNKQAIFMSLIQLADRFSEEQWHKVFDELLAGFDKFRAKSEMLESLEHLMAKIPNEMVIKVAIKLWTKITKIQQESKNIRSELSNRDDDVDLKIYLILVRLADRLLEEQVVLIIDQLLARLDNSKMQHAVIKSLEHLADRFSEKQWLKLIDAVSARFGIGTTPKNLAIERLEQLMVKIPDHMVNIVLNTLWAKFNTIDRDFHVQTAMFICLSLVELADRFAEEQWLKVLDGLVKVSIEYEYTHLSRYWYSDRAALQKVAIKVFEKLMAKIPEVMRDKVQNELNIKIIDLLEGLNDESKIFRIRSVIGLSLLAAEIPNEMLDNVITKLLAKLDDKKKAVRDRCSDILEQLIARSSPKMLSKVLPKLMAKLDKWDRDIFVKELGNLASQLNQDQASEIIMPLLARLDDRYSDVREAAIESLRQFFSVKVQLQLLNKCIISAKDETVDEAELRNEINKKVLFRLFSYLDQKTLLHSVPYVNQDWHKWQMVYLQHQAQNVRENHLLFVQRLQIQKKEWSNRLSTNSLFYKPIELELKEEATNNTNNKAINSDTSSSLNKNHFTVDNSYWYSAEDINKLLTHQLTNHIVEICAGLSPFLNNVQAQAVALFNDILAEVLNKDVPAVIPINLVEQAPLDAHGLAQSLQGTHWIGLCVLPLTDQAVYSHKIVIVDSFGNGLGQDKDISALNLLEILDQVDAAHPRRSLWEQVSRLVGLMREVIQARQLNVHLQIEVTGAKQQTNGSDCGAFVVQNLVSLLQDNRLCEQKGEELRQLHAMLLEQGEQAHQLATNTNAPRP